MSKFFKLIPSGGGSKITIQMTGEHEGNIEAEYEVKNYPKNAELFEKLFAWCSLDCEPFINDLFAPLVIGNYKFTPLSVYRIERIDRSGVNARVMPSSHSIRGSIELIDSHKRSTLSQDIDTHFERPAFP